MPKHDPMSAKAIGNRQKLVGLQKLKWYCQMCQKQCRDENGFKCHTMSESHLRQMRVFAENPHSVLDEFSQEFERGFLETLSSLHGTKRVKANTVYQEYIADKHHIHMNATIWTTLTGFCMHLGKESKAIVDETEKGWFIQWVDRDPKLLARQAQAEQRQKFELDEEERRKREIAAQVQAAEERLRASGQDGGDEELVDNSLVREQGDQKVTVALAPVVTSSLGLKKRPRQDLGFGADDDDEGEAAPKAKASAAASIAGGGFPGPRNGGVPFAGYTSAGGATVGGSSLAPLERGAEASSRAMEAARPPATEAGRSSASASTSASVHNNASGNSTGAANSSNNQPSGQSHKGGSNGSKSWLYRGLVVKVVNKEVARGRLYKQKGRVERVLGRDYDEAEVEVDGEVHVLRLKDLETSIPRVGQAVMVVRGRAAGVEGELAAIHEADYNCDVRVTQRGSELCGQLLRGLEYEDVCKYAP